MKKLIFIALALGLFYPFTRPSHAEVGIPTTMNIRNTATSTLWTVYASVGSSTHNGTLKGVSNVAVYNGTAAAIAIGVNTDTCGSSTVDAFVVPATTGFVAERVAIKKSICVRSVSGSSVGTGTIYTSAW